MAETLLSFGVEKLWNLLGRESERFQGVEEQFNELKSDLNMLRFFLKDADAKKHTSAMVSNTLKEVKEIVYDAEDIIETFLIKEELGKTSGITKRVKKFASVIVERRGLACDMESISKRISKVMRQMKSFGVQNIIINDEYTQSLQQERQRETRQTFSNDNRSILVGLEKNVIKLVGYLVEEDSQVVSIIGMGGIGKTTLAREVFNHETVKRHFVGLAWVCVSQQFTRKYVWHTILRKLRPGYKEIEMTTEDELQEKLFRVLETQKVLIVLDDIWREEDWDRTKPIFPREKGWKVLLTSRNEGVAALQANLTCVTFKPKCLTSEESWTMFQRIAFHRENTSEYEVSKELEELGKQMVEHCGGLPLAIKVLGGLLSVQNTLREWKRLYENIKSHIIGGTSSSDKDISSLYHLLYLRFEELPIYLKNCFLYLAHFPEDYAIDVGNLAYYWAAEEIPRPRYYEGATIQEVANIYIEELVKRNMVIAKRDFKTSRFEICHVHDMMREVCLHKAKEDNFVETIDTSTITSPLNSQSPYNSRRLSIHSSNDAIHMEEYIKNPKLRSLLILKKQFWGSKWMASGLFFTKVQLMRVLDLCGVEFEGGKLPSTIGKLIHLRYLSLYMAKVSHLPSSMRNLKLLLYLNLKVLAGSPLDVPNILKEMIELRYLWLPDEIKEKANLELGDLINMEILENFSTKHSSVRDLERMTRLATLSILLNGGCTMETLSTCLGTLRRLENLSVRGHMFKTNEYFMDVFRCLEGSPMLVPEILPQLEGGERRMVFPGDVFPLLQKLYLRGLDDLEELILEGDSMPLLHTLFISHCNNLKELPDGVRFISSLKDLSIVTTKREFREKLYRGGEDYYKVQHIPLFYIPVVSMTNLGANVMFPLEVRVDNQFGWLSSNHGPI